MKLFAALSTLLLSLSSYGLVRETTSLIIEPVSASSINSLSSVSGVYNIKPIKTFGVKGIKQRYTIEISSDTSKEVIKKLKALRNIKSVELNHQLDLYSNIKLGHAVEGFNGYQWGLHSSGQTLIREKTPITNHYIKAKPGIDIGWSEGVGAFNKNLKETPAVAVIDTGLSWTHPDLKNQILVNPIECQQKARRGTTEKELCKGSRCRPEKKPPGDRDNNGLDGDCVGWDFTAKRPRNAMSPLDRGRGKQVGHGTHISGIIAANGKQGLKYQGVSHKIKILPLKVFSQPERSESKSDYLKGLTSHIIEAMAYAASRNVKVINASFGVPEAAVNESLKEALRAVIDSGVTIVAAAGNNEHSEPIYPCALTGVICVGAMTADGSATDFTNYGGHVDLIAPGENILSTFPALLNPDVWPSQNYEVINGTSQAAPFVSGIVALMRARWPQITNDDVIGLLHQGSLGLSFGNKFFNGSLPKLNLITGQFKKPIIKPVLKELGIVTYKKLSQSLEFPLAVKNYGLAATNIAIEVSAKTNNIVSFSNSFVINSLAKSEVFSKKIPMQLVAGSSDSNIILDIKINGESYTHSFHVARDLQRDSSFKKIKVLGADNNESRLLPIVETYNKSSYPIYYWFNEKEGRGYLDFYKYKLGALSKVKTIKTKYQKTISLMKSIDLNYDGNNDYFIYSIGERKATEEEREERGCSKNDECLIKFYIISYLDNNLQPLFNGSERIIFNPKHAVLSKQYIETLRFLPQAINGKNIAMPVFQFSSTAPEVDADPENINGIKERLYYLKYDLLKNQFSEFVIDNYAFMESLKSQIENISGEVLYDLYSDVRLSQLLHQNEQDYYLGKLNLVVTAGEEALSESYLLEVAGFSDNFNVVPAYYNYENYNGGATKSAQVTHLVDSSSDLTAVVSFQDTSILRMSYIDSKAAHKYGAGFTYTHDIPKDFLLIGQYFHSYVDSNKYYSFYGSRQSLIAATVDKSTGESKFSSRPIVRSDFISGFASSQLLYPVSAKKAGLSEPAMFVDDSQLNSRRIFLWKLDSSGQLVSPLKYSVFIPENCIARSPVIWGDSSTYSMTAFCTSEEGDLELLLLPIKD